MGKELRTRFKIYDEVKIVSLLYQGKENAPTWAIGQTGTIRGVWFDILGMGFVVEVCHPTNKMCFRIECRKVKRVSGSRV